LYDDSASLCAHYCHFVGKHFHDKWDDPVHAVLIEDVGAEIEEEL